MNTIEQAREVSARLHLGVSIANDRNIDKDFAILAKAAGNTIDALIAENAALLAANRDSMDHYNELRAELEKIKAQPVPERAEETHCPHGILIADWCKQCFDETNIYFESIEDKP